jgi:hypothetical protein
MKADRDPLGTDRALERGLAAGMQHILRTALSPVTDSVRMGAGPTVQSHSRRAADSHSPVPFRAPQ